MPLRTKLVLLCLFFIIGCADYPQKPLPFVVPSTLQFQIQESDQAGKFRLHDSVVYKAPKDSFIICQDYTHIKPKSFRIDYSIKEYYFPNSNKDLVDHVLLSYYQYNLISVELITKGKERIYPLRQQVEHYFEKKFEWDKYQSTNNPRMSGHIQRKEWYVACSFYPNDEMRILIINTSKANPLACHAKPRWWQYLEFWRWL